MSRSAVPTWLAALAATALFALMGSLRHEPGALRGDEGTFVAMTASLVRDGDLRFDVADAEWARARPGRPAALILERTERGVFYSKPVLYPLLAAPFYAVAGAAGFWLLHLLMLAAALVLARGALARRGDGEAATATVVLFVCGSTVVPYLAWRMTESLQVAIATAGLSLALARDLGAAPPSRDAVDRWLAAPSARWVGAALLGLLVALREPNAAVAAVPVLAAVGARRWRRALALAATTAVVYGLVVGATWGLTGATSPYKAVRTTFTGETGYPLAGEPEALGRFEALGHRATSRLTFLPEWDPVRTVYAAGYFLVGRHTGALIYFPAAVALLGAAFAASDRAGRAALAGFAAAAAFYLVWWPENYFGGDTTLGNRYALAAYPCLLFAPARLPSRRLRAVAWALGLAVAGSAVASVRLAEGRDPSSQSHAHAGLFRWLPYESTAPLVEGRRDRYWAGDFVRFVDPFARVEPASFVLAAGERAAEVEIATRWPGTPLRWLASSDAGEATVVVSDWLRTRRIRLEPRGTGSGGEVAFPPSPAWRRHPFWFGRTTPFRTRLVRLRLESPVAGATVRLRYLGERGVPTDGFGRELLAVELPETGVAGETARIPVRVVHRGGWPWSSEATLPVYLGAELAAADGAVTEFRTPLGATVERNETLDAALELRWPETPGHYRLTVDLVLEEVAWFAERAGEPLAAGEVSVVPAAAGSPAPNRP